MVTVGDTTGLFAADEEPSDPCHDHTLAFVELANNVADPVLHIGPLFVGPASGVGLTVTVVIYIVDGLQPLGAALTVNE